MAEKSSDPETDTLKKANLLPLKHATSKVWWYLLCATYICNFLPSNCDTLEQQQSTTKPIIPVIAHPLVPVSQCYS